MSLYNEPGTFYIGGLTGPHHEVRHCSCLPRALLDIPGIGLRTVTVMFRTALFGHDRSRFKSQTPKPKALVRTLTKAFTDGFERAKLRLPTLEEIIAVHQSRFPASHTPAETAQASTSKKRRIIGKHADASRNKG